MHGSDSLTEANRLMTVCNSCRYCEGLCAVFPAMEMRRTFSDGDLNYLANLCHNCGACYVDCQFSPPHEFDVNVPRSLARVRAESYRHYAWPPQFRPFYDRNALGIALVTAISAAGFFIGFMTWHDPSAVFSTSGRFYALMPHTAMAWLFSLAALYAIVALGAGVRAFWHDIRPRKPEAATYNSICRALADVATLRYLDGGGVGCYNKDERPSDRRRLYHHLTFYGFLLCFAATCLATIYHYLLDMAAPYAWYQLPKLFGVPGGVVLVIGTSGLLVSKRRRDTGMVDVEGRGMDTAFLAMLLLTALSGLLLMFLRDTPAMGTIFALHLGIVLALFLTMPYGKFVHGLYRTAALIIHANERQTVVVGR